MYPSIQIHTQGGLQVHTQEAGTGEGERKSGPKASMYTETYEYTNQHVALHTFEAPSRVPTSPIKAPCLCMYITWL